MKYAVQEMPNITDSELIRLCVAVQQMRRTLVAFFKHVVEQLVKTPVTSAIRVVLGIMGRLEEGSLSVELLCQKGRTRDAAILLLSLHELRLDLQYIAMDPVRAETWLDHAREDIKPWRVKTQINEIFTDEKERDAERGVYRQYSMAKHGNRVAQQFAFGISPTRDALVIDCSGIDNPLLHTHMFGLGMHIHGAGIAAAKILAHEGIECDDFPDTLNEQFEVVSQHNQQKVRLMLEEWLSQKPSAQK